MVTAKVPDWDFGQVNAKNCFGPSTSTDPEFFTIKLDSGEAGITYFEMTLEKFYPIFLSGENTGKITISCWVEDVLDRVELVYPDGYDQKKQ